MTLLVDAAANCPNLTVVYKCMFPFRCLGTNPMLLDEDATEGVDPTKLPCIICLKASYGTCGGGPFDSPPFFAGCQQNWQFIHDGTRYRTRSGPVLGGVGQIWCSYGSNIADNDLYLVVYFLRRLAVPRESYSVAMLVDEPFVPRPPDPNIPLDGGDFAPSSGNRSAGWLADTSPGVTQCTSSMPIMAQYAGMGWPEPLELTALST